MSARIVALAISPDGREENTRDASDKISEAANGEKKKTRETARELARACSMNDEINRTRAMRARSKKISPWRMPDVKKIKSFPRISNTRLILISSVHSHVPTLLSSSSSSSSSSNVQSRAEFHVPPEKRTPSRHRAPPPPPSMSEVAGTSISRSECARSERAERACDVSDEPVVRSHRFHANEIYHRGCTRRLIPRSGKGRREGSISRRRPDEERPAL